MLATAFISSGQTQTIPGGAEAGRVEQRFDEATVSTAQPRVTQGLESTMAPAEAAQVILSVERIEVVGSTVYDPAELATDTEIVTGQTVPLTDVFAVAAAITARYRNDGYSLSRVIVPLQELDADGAVIRLEVVEGYVEEVRWPDELSRYRNFFDYYTAKITAARPFNVKTAERYLLLASDLPGFDFDSTLVPSETTPIASVMVVEVEEYDRFSGYASVSNHGVEASGPYQGSVGGSLYNALSVHERIDLAFTAAGPSENGQAELHYVSWGYEQAITAEGLTVFFDGNYGDGEPGTESLLALGYETKGLNLSGGLKYPIIRSRPFSLFGLLAFDFKNSESFNLGVKATEDRLRIVRGELLIESADERGGINLIELGLHKGIDGLGSTKNDNTLASRLGGQVDFFKFTAEASRRQKLPRNFELFGQLFVQLADDALLSSQECGYGGQTYGRGFDSSLITGDQCLLASLEIRRNLPVSGPLAKWVSYAQPYAFIDYGHIWNINPPGGTPEYDDGSSAGVGLRFGGEKLQHNVAVSTVVLRPESQTDVSQVRGWFQTTFRF